MTTSMTTVITTEAVTAATTTTAGTAATMTDSPRAASGRWPVVAAVAPAAALLFTGAAAWASLTAPQPSPPDVGAAAATAAPTAPEAAISPDPAIAALQRRLEVDRKRLDTVRSRLAARKNRVGPAAGPAPVAPARPAAPAPAAPRPAAPPPPVDTSTGASG
jgi:translation initiation factor IF-3